MKDPKTFISDPENFQHYDTLVRKGVNSYLRKTGLSKDNFYDLYSAGWIGIMEVLSEYDVEDLPEDRFFMRTVIHKCINVTRHEVKHQAFKAKSLDAEVFDDEGNSTTVGDTIADEKTDAQFTSSDTEVKELISSVSNDPVKLRYLLYYLRNANILSLNDAKRIDSAYEDTNSIGELARSLGFSATNDWFFRNLCDSMDKYINAYFGTNLTRSRSQGRKSRGLKADK